MTPPLLAADVRLVVGSATIFAALLACALLLLLPDGRAPRLRPARDRRGLADRAQDAAHRATTMADGALDRTGRRGVIERRLEAAGSSMRASEAVVAAGTAALAALFVGGLIRGLLLGVLFAGAVVTGGWLWLGVLRDRRRTKFGGQLPELLQMLAGSLRIGHGIGQALEMAAVECEAPISEELRRATSEARLGRDLSDALSAVAVRMDNEDFGWVVHAISINREVGGDLAEVLDAVTETIQARASLSRHVKALSAEGRISATVLLALPPGAIGLMSTMNPGYASPLFSTGRGLMLVVLAVVLMAGGSVWLRRLVRPIY
jgi:tight adherence protein B